MSLAEQGPIGAEKPPGKERSGIGTGLYLPGKVLTNEEIGSWGVVLPSGRPLTSEAIWDRIGVERRHIANPFETVAYMGFKAAEAALGRERDIDLIITSSSHPTPYNVSEKIGRELGITDASLMDVHAACSGSARMFEYLHENKEELEGKKVLLIATEKLSDTVINLQVPDALQLDSSLSQTILGDGAAAVSFTVGEDLITHFAANASLPSPDGEQDLITMGLGENDFVEPYINHPVACKPLTAEHPKGYFSQNGPAVYSGVQSNIPGIIRIAVAQAGFRPDEIDLVVMHPGSKVMINALRKRLTEFQLHAEYTEGNMSSTSMLYALVNAIDKKLVGRGSKIVLSGFGAGSPHLFSSTVVAELG